MAVFAAGCVIHRPAPTSELDAQSGASVSQLTSGANAVGELEVRHVAAPASRLAMTAAAGAANPVATQAVSRSGASGNGAIARETVDGSDDSIVVRRLRQAAAEETDPKLKQRLWKEYADFRQNANAE
jgi:hypothetical protein